jgi:adenylate kinase
MNAGEPVPDNILNPLVEKRIKQSDCKVNGWILEGFLYTRSQINLLKALKIKPSTTLVFNCDEETCVRRKTNVKVDPQTGVEYNILESPPSDEATNNRLIDLVENSEEIVRKQYKAWKSQVILIEENFKAILNVEADRETEMMTEYLAEEIENTFAGRP